MASNEQTLQEIIDFFRRGEDIPEMHLRWAGNQTDLFGFATTPTQRELRDKMIELHYSI